MAIAAGNFSVAAQLVVNGLVIPCTSFELDLNAYSLATNFTARSPIYPYDGTTRGGVDWSKQHQIACDAGKELPIEIQVSYEQVSPTSSISQQPTRFLTLEHGAVDIANGTYDANEWEFSARVAPNLQDTRIAGALPQRQRGDQLVQYLFAKYQPDVALTTTASPLVQGHDDDEFAPVKSARGQSAWDYMAIAAAEDGYVLSIHNRKATYGPPGQSGPTVNLAWGKDLTQARITHAARRTRNILVKVYALNRRGQYALSAYYPQGNVSSTQTGQTEIYPFFKTHQQKYAASDLQFAKARYLEIASKEFIAEIEMIPDATLLQTIAANGARFLMRLEGVMPSHARLYHVKQAHVAFATTEEEPQLTVRLTGENHVPSQSGFS